MAEGLLRVEDGMIVLYIDGVADTNFGFGASVSQVTAALSTEAATALAAPPSPEQEQR